MSRPEFQSQTLSIIDQLLRGSLLTGVPNLEFVLIDLRNVAEVHVKAAEAGSAYIYRGRSVMMSSIESPKFSSRFMLLRITSKPRTIKVDSAPFGPLMGLTPRWLNAKVGIRFSVESFGASTSLGLSIMKSSKLLLNGTMVVTTAKS